MCPEKLHPLLINSKGFGLVSAIFVIVILALFGLLVARFVGTSSISSSEDYRWAQALYAAESAAQLRILHNDNGGIPGYSPPAITDFTITETNNFAGVGNPSTLRIEATMSGISVSREIEVKYVL